MRNPWIPDPYGEEEEHLHPDLQFSWQERLRMAWQAMKGALLIGAVYLDGGLTPARMLIERFILTDIEHKKLFYDSKTVLQEIVQRDLKGREICYVVTKEEGPDHAKHFEVNVTIGGELAGQGEGSTKKSAEQKAAYQAILALKKD